MTALLLPSFVSAKEEAKEEAKSDAKRLVPRVVVLGDSITAGYGLKKEEAYPELLRKMAADEGRAITVVNAGLSGDTTRGGLRRLAVLARQPMDILVIALGGNDGLRGIEPKVSQRNLELMIDRARASHPEVHVLLAGMQMPDNMGEEYTREFQRIFAAVGKKKQVAVLPFLLEGVAMDKDLNLADGIHPNARGQQVVARHVYPALKALIEASEE
ncbi:arylesterase [Verrucomicrobiaceae bacterium N1E253]|uniref:Arylesterase n=1 Tax=Oceaniferula marina TaxID=2748318 RepID=A0A851GR19_9BACT|nr:arylesterase [Oceaniferula marina]NWK57250.1 arylesterase [Oceaniferula marina]